MIRFVFAIQFSAIEILHCVFVIIIVIIIKYLDVVIYLGFFLSKGPEGSFSTDRKPSGTDHWQIYYCAKSLIFNGTVCFLDYDAEVRKEDIKHVHKIKKREASYKSHRKVGDMANELFE